MIRLSEDADALLRDLRRKLSAKQGEDLTLGDVVAEALKVLADSMGEG